jgi:multidrug efflux system outer membrane protein
VRRHLSAMPASVVFAVVLAGCTTGPDYVRPTVETPASWRIEYVQAVDVANTAWWEQFGDPALSALIEQALQANPDLRIAAARVEQFIGLLDTTRSQFYPQVGYGLNASHNRSSRVGVPPLAPGADPYYSLYQGSLTAQWQIDLFGRVRRQSEAAQARLFASEQGRRGVVLSVTTALAASYVTLRGLDRQLEIARATADNYAGSLQIFQKRYKGGAASQVQVEQVQSQYQQALAAIPVLEQQVAAQENLICTLLGRNPGPIARGKTIDQLAAPAIPADLPSTLLERRPDILQAEQNLVAANADVGVARSLYYPTLSLTGVLGSVSTAFSDFLSSASAAGSLAAGFAGPIFTFGAIEGQVQTAEAAQREALANYERIVQNAFRETNDALIGAQKRASAAQAHRQRADALREYARLSVLKYDSGYADYLEVLYAQNELFAAELSAVGARVDAYTQVIAVYGAVGGGWVDLAAQRAPAVRTQPRRGQAGSP